MIENKGFVVPAGGGKHLDMRAPGRFAGLTTTTPSGEHIGGRDAD